MLICEVQFLQVAPNSHVISQSSILILEICSEMQHSIKCIAQNACVDFLFEILPWKWKLKIVYSCSSP